MADPDHNDSGPAPAPPETPEEQARKAAEKEAADALREKERVKMKALLDSAIDTVRAMMDDLTDPALGPVSESFRQETTRVIRAEDVNPEVEANAVYLSFLTAPHPGQNGFTNTIAYGKTALENADKLLSARVHEFIHALQYDKAACLHADPYNSATNIIVSPLDYILRKERLEQDAYVKGAWLCALAKDKAPGIVAAMAMSPLPVHVFEQHRKQSLHLQDTFNAAARDARNAEGTWVKKDELCKISDVWHARALAEYERILDDRLKYNGPMTLVRLSSRDIHEIGASFGPNTFGTDPNAPHLSLLESLSPENRKKLDELEAKYGITDRNSLYTLEDELSFRGDTRENFIRQSKNYVGPPRPPEAAAAPEQTSQYQSTGATPAPVPWTQAHQSRGTNLRP